MKNIMISIFCLGMLCSGYSISAQNLSNKNKDIGTLRGDVYFITLFVDTYDGYWEEEEIKYCTSEFEKSQEWIKAEANFYKQSINFINDHFFFDHQESVYINKIEMGHGARRLVRQVIEERGYGSLKEFLRRNDYNESLDRLKIILFVKSNGRSHAYNIQKIENVDIAVVYFKSTYGSMTNHHVISHEILHQFGAWDLYYGESQSLESAKKAKELYPNSIMISTGRNNELEVDELTAWRIGWKEAESTYYQFIPDRNREDQEKKKSHDEGIQLKFSLKKKNKEN